MSRDTVGSSHKYRRATAVVEMAVVMPIVFIICFGLIEISRLLMLQHTADAAAYEAAREGMVPGATANEAIAAANVLLNADGLKGTSVTVSPDVITESTPVLTVSVSIPVSQNSWLNFFSLGSSTITSEISLYCERPPVALLTGTTQMKLKLKDTSGKTKGTGL